MVELIEIAEENWLAYAGLSVREEQSEFVARAIGIIARGYVYRHCNARVFGIADGGRPLGLALVRDMDEEPVCYDLQQFMIDGKEQQKGFGTQALRLILELLARERHYDCVEVCVNRADASALRLYMRMGFVDTGYIDPEVPDSLNLRYRFP